MAIHTSKFLDGSIRINSLFHAKVLILNLMTKGAPCIHKQRNKLSDFSAVLTASHICSLTKTICRYLI